MKFNPSAIALWGFCGIVGYLINDGRGALIGLAIGLGISILAEFVPKGRR